MKTCTALSLTFAFAVLVVSNVQAQAGGQAPSGAQAVQRDLSPERFNQAISTGDFQLIDVRTPKEFSAGHIAGAVNIDWTAADYETTFARIDAAKPLLLYCHGGGRSEQALEYLLDEGYRVQHLDGGIVAWRKAGLPEVK
ncbi:MAG TPA: rhodanese-like domain-containing protein [Flavobacteriales bacterium]|nr:rhodanese-like domain-containing protein [Flavobacteriales bacterium]